MSTDEPAEPEAAYLIGLGLKRALLVLVLACVAIGVVLAMRYHLDLEQLKRFMASLIAAKDRSPWLFAMSFFAVHVAITALCIPIEVLMTVAAGALFGLVEGTILISFASSIGATLAFLGSRFFLRNMVKTYFAKAVASVDEGLRRDGIVFLLSLRLLPIFPFFLVNIVMGLTAIRTKTFYVFSQIGMLTATCLYANAGTQLAQINKLSDIFSPVLISTLVLLSAFPWLAKLAINLWQQQRHHTRG